MNNRVEALQETTAKLTDRIERVTSWRSINGPRRAGMRAGAQVADGSGREHSVGGVV